MAYAPLEPDVLVPGILGTTEYWQDICDNLDEVYAEYGPIWAMGFPEIQSAAGSWTAVAHWVMPANDDNEDVALKLRWYVSGGATARARMTVGATTSSTISTTSATVTDGTCTLTPSGSGTTRSCYLEVQIQSGAGTCFVDSLSFYGTPSSPSGGVLSSGYARTAAQWYATDEPIASERVERLLNGPRLIAIDRPAGVLTIMGDASAATGRARMETSASDYVTVGRGMLAWPDTSTRTYRFAVRLADDAGGTPAAMIRVGPYELEVSGSGWQQTTQDLDGTIKPVEVLLKKSAGSGNVFVHTVQILRDP